MDETGALSAFSALSHETRLAILRMLVPVGTDGLNAGQIAEAAQASSSRLSFHLSALEQAGLILSSKKSRNVIYSANYENLGALVRYLTEDCCAAHPAIRCR